MTVYPGQLDDDQTLIRVDDNISEIGGEAINQLRSAVFSLQQTIGINPQGSLTSLGDRISVSLNENGTIRQSALTSIGLVTLPIDNSQIGNNAGILESKLALDYSTSNLNAQLQHNAGLFNTLNSFAAILASDFGAHLAGGNLADGSSGRHVASQIDLNAIPSDPRDPAFSWGGLFDRNGNLRPGSTVASALLEINNDLVSHELDENGGAHFASGISVNTDNFNVIPKFADTVQKALDAIDKADALVIQEHQQNQHTNGIPRESRSFVIGNVDGYSYNIIPPTPAIAYLVNPPSNSPVDNNTTGDNIISFNPNNSGFNFDSLFAQVSIGDVVRINYGNGVEGVFSVESKRHIPGYEWIIRIDGINLFASDGYASARIDKKRFDTDKYGSLAVASANNDLDSSIMGSVIISDPKGAQACGIGFDPTQLNSTHYNLYLAIYPNGNPQDEIIALPAIDVTGNAGATPGYYTLSGVVQTVNDAFRASGYNYRFIAFERDGNFGIMLADSISNVSFSIINGVISGGILDPGGYVNNVIGDATDDSDALGFGVRKAGFASPYYSSNYSSSAAAVSLPTIIFRPLAGRNFVSNGISRDSFVSSEYWDGYISARIQVGITTVETTYEIPMNLSHYGLKSGKTLVIQPAIPTNDVRYSNVDYGRFIIKSVNFSDCCPDDEATTSITVVNSLHAFGNPVGISGGVGLPVRVYFSADSVSFDNSNVIDPINASQYIRYHEIFITEEGSAFSHERARIPIQAESTNLINTVNGFTLTNVSPKIKGYLDSATDQKRFVRFYITSYNSASGEYDGYIGRRLPGIGITDTGRITTGRKNIPVRFYDSSDVDYVEIKYTEEDIYPGTDIISTNSPRYVDIELFGSLATNQEYLRLASCNLISNRVQEVVDLREFGNVSEIDFTDSAVRFIEAGNRYLQSNGIINGFTFIGEDDVISGRLAFNGGVAIVDGHITTANSQYISIPEVLRRVPAPDFTESNLDWAICVNKNGNLVALPLLLGNEQFFARTLASTDTYYIDSASFSDLVFNRKDLAIIAVVNVTIASVTVNSVYDARKIVYHQNNSAPFVLARNDDSSISSEVIGTFSSFDQVKVYANNLLVNGNVYVKIKGNFLIDQQIDLRGLTNPICLDGFEDNYIVVTSQNGLVIDSNIKIRNLNFLYNADFSGLTVGDNAHLTQKRGCIFIDATESISNVEISSCTFRRTNSSQRAPFIDCTIQANSIVSNVNIFKNIFTPGDVDTLNCAIGFYSELGGTPGTGYIEDVNIYKNKVHGKNSILITNANAQCPSVLRNVNIYKNDVFDGMIGYSSVTNVDGYYPIETGLSIDKNTAVFIGNAGFNGKYSGIPVASYGTGFTEICNNKAVTIQTISYDRSSNPYPDLTQKQQLIIDSNTLMSRVSYATLGSDFSLSYVNTAIGVFGFSDGYSVVNICENKIISSSNNIYGYGIVSESCICNISRNNINRFSIYGIFDNTFVPFTGSIISENRINRRGIPVSGYIYPGSSLSRVFNNIFDSRSIDGISSQTIAFGGTNAFANINHVVTQQISGFVGQKGVTFAANAVVGSGLIVLSYLGPLASLTTTVQALNFYTTGPFGVEFQHDGNSTQPTFIWSISLKDIIPHGARILAARVSARNGSSNNTNVSATLYLRDGNTTLASDAVLVNVLSTEFIVSIEHEAFITQNHSLVATISSLNSTGAAELDLYSLFVTYTW